MSEEIGIEELAPWFVLVITFVGVWLRVYLLGGGGLWLDETFSIWVAKQNIPDMLQWIIKIDPHPPLYYLLLHYWIVLKGDSAYYVRLFSALFGAGTIPVIYLIGKRMSGAVMGLAAATFLSLSLFNIYYAQETRMYTLLAFNVAVAMYALVRLLTDPRAVHPIGSQFRDYLQAWRASETAQPDPGADSSKKAATRQRWLPIQTIETDLAWVAWIVFSAATLLTHNTAFFFLLAVNLFVFGLMLFQRIKKPGYLSVFQAPSFANWVMAQLGIFLLWSPWCLAFIRQALRVDQEFWIPQPTFEIVTQTLRSLLNPGAPGQSNQVMLWVLGAVLCLGPIYFRKKPALFLFLAALFAIPFLGELIVSLRRPIFLDRTLIWITIPLFLLLAAGIAQLRFRFLIIVVMGALITNSLFSAGDYFRFFQKEDWSTPAGIVAYSAQENDLILFNSNFVEIPFNYYFGPFEEQYSLKVVKQGVPQDLFNDGILEPKMTNSDVPGLISLLHGHNRVWLVYSHDWYTDPLGLIPQTLASQMKLIQESSFYGGKVQLYGNP